jgi:hypothetical protein
VKNAWSVGPKHYKLHYLIQERSQSQVWKKQGGNHCAVQCCLSSSNQSEVQSWGVQDYRNHQTGIYCHSCHWMNTWGQVMRVDRVNIVHSLSGTGHPLLPNMLRTEVRDTRGMVVTSEFKANDTLENERISSELNWTQSLLTTTTKYTIIRIQEDRSSG